MDLQTICENASTMIQRKKKREKDSYTQILEKGKSRRQPPLVASLKDPPVGDGCSQHPPKQPPRWLLRWLSSLLFLLKIQFMIHHACDHHIEQHSHEFGVSQLRGVGGLVAMQIVMGNQVVWLLPRPSRVVAPLGLDYQLCHFGRRCVTKSEINDRRSWELLADVEHLSSWTGIYKVDWMRKQVTVCCLGLTLLF